MTEKKRKRLMYGILVAAIIWGIWNNPFADRKKSSTASQPEVTSSVQSMADSIVQAQLQHKTRESNKPAMTDFPDLGWHRDPFAGHPEPRITKKPDDKQPMRQPFKLSGISSVGEQRMAIINGKLAGPQAVVEGWTVARIDPEAVLLKKGDQKKTLKLNGDQ
jgi:hypothetical protein